MIRSIGKQEYPDPLSSHQLCIMNSFVGYLGGYYRPDREAFDET